MSELKRLEGIMAPLRTTSGWVRCPDCLTFGVCMPFDRVCGNCGEGNCILLYDEKAVLSLVKQVEKEHESEYEGYDF